MFTENEVVDIVCEWLKHHEYEDIEVCHNTEPGPDVDASAPNRPRVRVECKGAKSPKTGKAFDRNYLWKCAAGAFFNTVRASAGEKIIPPLQRTIYGIAIPDTKLWHEYFDPIESLCKRENIPVFWVRSPDSITLWGDIQGRDSK